MGEYQAAQDQSKYVLRLKNKSWFSKEKELTAEKKGLLTLLWAKVFCRSQYNLPTILNRLSTSSQETLLPDGIKKCLEDVVQKYTKKHPKKAKEVNDLFNKAFPKTIDEPQQPTDPTTTSTTSTTSLSPTSPSTATRKYNPRFLRSIQKDAEVRSLLARYGLFINAKKYPDDIAQERTREICEHISRIRFKGDLIDHPEFRTPVSSWNADTIKAFLTLRYRSDFVSLFSHDIPRREEESVEDHEARIRQDLENPNGKLAKKTRIVIGEHTTCIPKEIEQLQQVREIHIRSDKIQYLPMEMQKLHNLETLTLSKTSSLQYLPMWLTSLPKLEQVKVEKTPHLDRLARALNRTDTSAATSSTPASVPPRSSKPTHAVENIPMQYLSFPGTISDDEDVQDTYGDDKISTGLTALNDELIACPVLGDGNCLFYSICVGFLARKNAEEIVQTFGQLKRRYERLPEAMIHHEVSEDKANQFSTTLNLLLDMCTANLREAPSPQDLIEAILGDENRQIRSDWAHCLRYLAVAEEFFQGDPLLQMARLDAEADLSDGTANTYIDTMASLEADPRTFGADGEIIALQTCLDIPIVRISFPEHEQDPYLVERFHTYFDRVSIQIRDITDNEIVVFSVGAHYDTAFLPAT